MMTSFRSAMFSVGSESRVKVNASAVREMAAPEGDETVVGRYKEVVSGDVAA